MRLALTGKWRAMNPLRVVQTKYISLSPLFFIAPLSASRVSRPVGFEGDKSTPPDDVIIPHGSHNCKLFLHFLLRHFQQIGRLNFFIFCAIFLLTFCGAVCYNISPSRRGRRCILPLIANSAFFIRIINAIHCRRSARGRAPRFKLPRTALHFTFAVVSLILHTVELFKFFKVIVHFFIFLSLSFCLNYNITLAHSCTFTCTCVFYFYFAIGLKSSQFWLKSLFFEPA